LPSRKPNQKTVGQIRLARKLLESAVLKTVIMALFGMTFIVQAVYCKGADTGDRWRNHDHHRAITWWSTKFIFAQGFRGPSCHSDRIQGAGDILVF